MDKLSMETNGHPVGFSGAKNEFRHGVNVGNFAEDILAADCHGAPGFPLRTGAHFVGESEAAASFTAAGKTGAQLAAGAVRQDLQTKYGKYGRSEALPTEAGLNCFATMSQLAYSGGVPRGSGGQPLRVHECLWSSSKFENRKVPVKVDATQRGDQQRRQWEAEASANPFTTVEAQALQRAAEDPGRAQAKPPLAQPRDKAGEDTQVGRKAAGEFKNHFDKDYLRIGLRK